MHIEDRATIAQRVRLYEAFNEHPKREQVFPIIERLNVLEATYIVSCIHHGGNFNYTTTPFPERNEKIKKTYAQVLTFLGI